MNKRILLLSLYIFLCLPASLLFAQRGKDGARVVNAPNTIFNEFTNLTANAAAGTTTIAVGNSGLNANGRFSASLAPGDLVMIIQIQGATIQGNVNNNTWGEVLTYNNCGLYEFKEVLNVPNSTTINFTCPLINNYTSNGKTQVIRVPRITSLTINNGGVLTTDLWNGQVGGVLVTEVLTTTIVNAGGIMNTTGKGFRGGAIEGNTNFNISTYSSTSANDGAEKGESIAGYKADYTTYGGMYGRGAPANGGGGGNAHNAGGGGGANAGLLTGWNGDGNPDNTNAAWTTAWNLEAAGFASNVSSGGGRGGYTYSQSNANAITQSPGNTAWGGDNRKNVGGKGGRPLDYTTGRLFLGGGGGAGDGNNGANQPGNSGGGLIYILSYGTISGAGSIISNGNSSSNTISGGNDAPGGGGGGGTVILNSVGAITGVSAIANGGTGGSQIIATNEAEGPGGGGGGGYIATSNGSITQQANGASNGTSNSNGVTEFIPNGATKADNGFINKVVTPPVILTTVNAVICSGMSATISATASGAVPPGAVITWYNVPVDGVVIGSGASYTTPPLTSTTIYYAQICPGTYRVPDTVFVNPLPALVTSQTHASCKFLKNGTGTVTPSLGSTPYTYSWSTSPVQTTSIATGLGAGTYSVTVTDFKGCTSAQSVTITEPLIIVATIISNNPVTCNGLNNGSLGVGAVGGTPPYTYSWSPTGGTSATASGLPAGNYLVIVSDSKGCQAIANQTITEPVPLAISSAQVNVICPGGTNGSATVTASGGSSPYTYLWNPGAQTNASATGLAAGTYSVIINDTKGCQVIRFFTITQPTITLSTTPIHVSCFGGNNGSAFANVSGGSPGYTYSWAPTGGIGSSATNLTAGTYTLTVRDANNCPTTTFFTISQPTLLNAPNTPVHISCYSLTNGSVSVSPNGGTVPYSYLWLHNGSTLNNVTGLAAGTFTYSVTDAKGCKITANVTLTQPPGMTLTTGFANATCGFLNGQVSVSVSGGTSPYTYNWQPGGASTTSVSGLGAGTYTVTVNQPNGCTQKKVVSINNLTGPVISISGNSPVSCNGGNNGSLKVSSSGGTTPYNFLWSPIGGTDSIATGLPAGTYNVRVTDFNNCVRITSATITEPSQLNSSIVKTDNTCANANNGIATVTAFGGTPGYTYLWMPGGQAGSTATGLPANTFTVTLTDANNCAIQKSVTITQPSNVIVTDISMTPVNCTGTNGTATVSATGGTPPYQYSWSPTGGSSSTAIGLGAGSYTVSVIDAQGCNATNSITLTQLAALQATVNSVPVSCFGGSNGMASISASGGQPPYTYAWTPSGGTGTTATGLSAGTYFASVVDSAGCVVVSTVNVSQPTQLTASVSPSNSVCTKPNGKASVAATGGTGPYTYSWSSSGGTNPVATGLMAGTYTVLVSDANGCSLGVSASIQDVPGGKALINTTNATCNGGKNGSATVTMTGGTFPFAYLWLPSNSTSSNATGLFAGTHTVIVTDANGCLDTAAGIVDHPQALIASTSPLAGITCSMANNGSATGSASGGVPSYTYAWSTNPPQNTQIAINLGPFTYSVTVTDLNGCSAMASVTITDPGSITMSPLATQHVNCYGGANGAATVSAVGGTPAYTYEWGTLPPQTGAIASGLKAGVYSVSIRDANGCIADTIVTIYQPDLLTEKVNGGTVSCAGQPITLIASGSGGTGVYNYLWQPSFIQADSIIVNPNTNTTYTVLVNDNNGCLGPMDTAIVTIIPFTKANVEVYAPATICPGDSTAISAKVTGFPGTFNYTWSTGLLGPGPYYVSPTATTIYIVTVSNICGSTVQDSVTISAKPVIPVMFSADTIAGCVPLCVKFTDNTMPPALSCKWSFGDGKKDSSTCNPMHCFTTAGIFDVKLTIIDTGGCTSVLTDTGMVTAYPIPVAGFQAVPPVTSIWTPEIKFTNTSTGDTLRRWIFGDGNSDSISKNPSHTYEKEGKYRVCLTVTSLNACIDSICSEVIVNPDWSFFIPNAFTPNEDGVNDNFIGKGWNVKYHEMWILDRWGNLIYETGRTPLVEAIPWNGIANDGVAPAQEDVYVYVIVITDIFNVHHKFVGSVTLVK